MDYRNRRYFLVQFENGSRQMRMRFIKNADPSVKFSPPYGHFAMSKYDGDYHAITEIWFPSCMIGCNADKATAVQYELNKMVREDRYSKYCKLDAFDLSQ